MTKKIAVLVNEDTMQRCSCGGCLKAFMNKADSFERYADEETELIGFSHSGGDLTKKLESFKKNGVTTIHLSTCTRGKNENYESIAEQCAEAGFDVVGYTHGGAVSKDGKEANFVLASTLKQVGKTVQEIATQTAGGKFPGGKVITFGLKDGGVDLTTSNLSEDAKKAVEDAKKQIIDGSVKAPEK